MAKNHTIILTQAYMINNVPYVVNFIDSSGVTHSIFDIFRNGDKINGHSIVPKYVPYGNTKFPIPTSARTGKFINLMIEDSVIYRTNAKTLEGVNQSLYSYFQFAFKTPQQVKSAIQATNDEMNIYFKDMTSKQRNNSLIYNAQEFQGVFNHVLKKYNDKNIVIETPKEEAKPPVVEEKVSESAVENKTVVEKTPEPVVEANPEPVVENKPEPEVEKTPEPEIKANPEVGVDIEPEPEEETNPEIKKQESEEEYNTKPELYFEINSELNKKILEMDNLATSCDNELQLIKEKYSTDEKDPLETKMEHTVNNFPDIVGIDKELNNFINILNEKYDLGEELSKNIFESISSSIINSTFEYTQELKNNFFEFRTAYTSDKEYETVQTTEENTKVENEPEQKPIVKEKVEEKPTVENKPTGNPIEGNGMLSWEDKKEPEQNVKPQPVQKSETKAEKPTQPVQPGQYITYIREDFEETDQVNVGKSGISLNAAKAMLNDNSKQYKIPYVSANLKSMIGLDDVNYYKAIAQEFTNRIYFSEKQMPNTRVMEQIVSKFRSFLGFEKYPFNISRFITTFCDIFKDQAPNYLRDLTTIRIHDVENYDLFEGLPMFSYILFVFCKYNLGLDMNDLRNANIVLEITLNSLETSNEYVSEDKEIDFDEEDIEEGGDETAVLASSLMLNPGKIWVELLNNLNNGQYKGIAALQYVFNNKNEFVQASSHKLTSIFSTNTIRFKLYEHAVMYDIMGNVISPNIASVILSTVDGYIMNMLNSNSMITKSAQEKMEFVNDYLDNKLGSIALINKDFSNGKLIVNNPYIDYNYLLGYIKEASLKASEVNFSDIIHNLSELNNLSALVEQEYSLEIEIVMEFANPKNPTAKVRIHLGSMVRNEDPNYSGDRSFFIPSILTKPILKYNQIVRPDGTKNQYSENNGYLDCKLDMNGVNVSKISAATTQTLVNLAIRNYKEKWAGENHIITTLVNTFNNSDRVYKLPASVEMNLKSIDKMMTIKILQSYLKTTKK